MTLHPELLEILACPKCKGALSVVGQEEGLSCAACKVVYPVREDIPIMLIEEAVPAPEWELGKRSAK